LLLALALLASLERLGMSQQQEQQEGEGGGGAAPDSCGQGSYDNVTATTAELLGRAMTVVEGAVVQVGALSSRPCTESAAILGRPSRAASLVAVEVVALYKGPPSFAPPDSTVAGGSLRRLLHFRS
jgi:hypothetical protein